MANDDLARMRAAMDQAKEGMKEFGGSLWAFYSGMIAEGFTSEQAMTLTVTFLAETLRMGASE
jgi:hypothetical protein